MYSKPLTVDTFLIIQKWSYKNFTKSIKFLVEHLEKMSSQDQITSEKFDVFQTLLVLSEKYKTV